MNRRCVRKIKQGFFRDEKREKLYSIRKGTVFGNDKSDKF